LTITICSNGTANIQLRLLLLPDLRHFHHLDFMLFLKRCHDDPTDPTRYFISGIETNQSRARRGVAGPPGDKSLFRRI
jgi:hypothetical protein